MSDLTSTSELEVISSTDLTPPNYPYLEECSISVEILSRCPGPILIDWVELRFVEEEGLSSAPIRRTGPSGVLRRNQRSSPISLHFRVPLTFRAGSNFFDVGINFRDAEGATGQAATKWFKSGQYIRVDTRPPRGKLIFISHTIPEDEGRARCVKTFLEKAGITGYIWEEDSRPGADYWPEKLYPKIDESNGLVAIWSAATEGRPEGVRKEVQRAKRERTPPCQRYPFLEDGEGWTAKFPLFADVFPPTSIELLRFGSADPRPAVVKLVEAIDQDIRNGVI